MSDYDAKRIEGFKAMERLPQGEVRTPTNIWSGLSLSKTSPFQLETAGISRWANREEHIPSKLMGTTGLLDSVPIQDRELSHFKDIHSLLNHLKLGHYISKFKRCEAFVMPAITIAIIHRQIHHSRGRS